MNELTTEDKIASVNLVATLPQDKTYGINPPEYRRAMTTAQQITNGLLEAGLHVTSVSVTPCEASLNDLAKIELLMPNKKTVIRFGVEIPPADGEYIPNKWQRRLEEILSTICVYRPYPKTEVEKDV